MHFTKLRVSGFKSFIDPVELLIEPGMTGIVGPNGCGKSNVVDALRWVMGEQNPRHLRGRAMDDMIFHSAMQVSMRSPKHCSERKGARLKLRDIGQLANI